jgi:HK97 family phage major capsid protein
VKAFQRASQVQQERAMAIGTDAAGGFALPFTLDPTVLLSSAGALKPIRGIARVETTTTNEWRGISSDGITTSYVGEAATASDDSPALAQPVVTCAQWRAFVPFSIELGQDWQGLQGELVRLVRDGRDTMDATAFWTGSGTQQPRGLTTDLTASQRVATSGATAFAVGDPWLLKADLPARFSDRATFAAHPTVWDATFRFVGGNSTEPEQFSGGRGGDFLGRPKVEWSSIGTQTSTTSGTIMAVGDFSNYLVADRLGVTAELIPHLVSGGTALHYPSGQRGLYCYGRTGAAALVPNAFRILVVS